MNHPLRSWSLALVPTVLTVTVAAQDGGFADALARYRECIDRVPFRHHVEAWTRIAETRQLEALALLAKDYQKPPAHDEQARYVIAELIGQTVSDDEALATLRNMRRQYDDPGDMWLWVNALKIEADRGGADDVLGIALDDKDATRQATAIVALGRARSSRLPQAILGVCAEFPRKESDRNVLLGAMSGAIYDNKSKVNDEEFRAALRAYIGLLAEDVKLTHTAKVQVARHLRWTLNGIGLFVEPEPWLHLLDRGDIEQKKDVHTVSAPRFFGIETEGERFCYVIDMSDSMCKQIHPSVKPQGPVTGPKPRKRPKGVLPDESDLPWHEINTRFELAREQLKISLQRLSKDKYFSVILFGTHAANLDSTPGMIKATKGNIGRVIKELDDIEPDPADAVKAPDGQLRGMTNMHAGLRRAFGLSGRGLVEECAYVDPAALTQGCDTIFLLSDGEPSWDDFDARDKDYGEGKVVVDNEYKGEAQRTPELIYHGPYVHDRWLVDDLERMNAFRRIRIHCIGIGEAKMDLLKQLAEIGHGEVMLVGKKANDRGGTR